MATTKRAPKKAKNTRIDMHCHTKGSDGFGSVEQFVAGIKAAKLDGVVITDHHKTITEEGLKIAKGIERAGFFVAIGCEYSTKQGHCLVYGVDVAKLDVGFYPDMQALIVAATKAGGVAFPSHPYRGGKYVLGGAIDKLKTTHVETLNGQNEVMTPHANKSALAVAAKRKLIGVGGSDAHRPEDLGTAYSEFSGNITTPQEMLDALRGGALTARLNDALVKQRTERVRAFRSEQAKDAKQRSLDTRWDFLDYQRSDADDDSTYSRPGRYTAYERRPWWRD